MAGGNLPFGLAPSGDMTSYTPTLSERATDFIRRKLFSDDRAGQQKASRVMDVAQFTPFGFATDMYDAGRAGGQGDYATAGTMMAMAFAPGPNPKIPGFRTVRKTPSSIDAYVGDANVGSINLSENHPYVSSIFVEPGYRGQGVGAALYGKAEADLGRSLVPSPLGLSDDAKKMWRKNLASMPREEAQKIIDEAWAIGRSYGVKDKDIEARLGDLLPQGSLENSPQISNKGFKAYHGSPHSFDKFDLSKIGTGVGAPDAFSRGLYFAESEKTAEHFKTLGASPMISGKKGRAGLSPDAYELVWKFTHNNGKSGTLADVASDAEADLLARKDGLPASAVRDYERIIDELKSRGNEDVQLGANMYEVNINADPASFVEWDKPISQQSEIVKNALSKFQPEQTWREVYESGMVRPADMLKQGIPGTTYKTNDGSRNYVVFDDKLIEILRKYGWAGALPFGFGAFLNQDGTEG
jgi:GNAT superfamily N-acetyltransferase